MGVNSAVHDVSVGRMTRETLNMLILKVYSIYLSPFSVCTRNLYKSQLTTKNNMSDCATKQIPSPPWQTVPRRFQSWWSSDQLPGCPLPRCTCKLPQMYNQGTHRLCTGPLRRTLHPPVNKSKKIGCCRHSLFSIKGTCVVSVYIMLL